MMFLVEDNLLIQILIALGFFLNYGFRVVWTNINVCWYSTRFTEWFIKIVT